MKIGFMLPQFGAMATYQNMMDMAQLAEERDFESVWAADHVIMPTDVSTPYPYSKSAEYIADPKGNHLEPFTMLSFIAGCTQRGLMGFTVIVAPYRHPIVTGKMMASIDVLSQGRLIAGVGAGWLKEEFDALQVSWKKRWAQTEEHIRIWKELWTSDEPAFDGDYYKFKNVQCRPQPIQRPHPPITIGGNGMACFRQIVALADGWQVVSEAPDDVYATNGDLETNLNTLRKLSEESGRDFETIEITAVIIAGTAKGVLEDLPRYQQIGVDRLILDFPAFVSEPTQMSKMLETIASNADMEH